MRDYNGSRGGGAGNQAWCPAWHLRAALVPMGPFLPARLPPVLARSLIDSCSQPMPRASRGARPVLQAQ